MGLSPWQEPPKKSVMYVDAIISAVVIMVALGLLGWSFYEFVIRNLPHYG